MLSSLSRGAARRALAPVKVLSSASWTCWRPCRHPLTVSFADADAKGGLAVHALPKSANEKYNPEWKAEGFEGGTDTNKLPWVEFPHMPGCFLKPLRASKETGAYTILVKVPKGVKLKSHVLLGAQDTFVLSGKLAHTQGPAKGELGPGTWSFLPAGFKIEGTTAMEDTEIFQTFHGPLGLLASDGETTNAVFTSADVQALAKKSGIPLLPNTLAESLVERPAPYTGKADPLAISDPKLAALTSHAKVDQITELSNPYSVDTNALPWIVDPAAPEIGIKVMRVSPETGHATVMVRQNGQAPPHYHLAPADFFILSGRIGYRAGPKEGYGPGTYMLEPAGARHEATQRVTDEDLIYTANIQGPLQFDTGPGTPVLLVQSWMQYLQAAEATNTPLLANN